MKSSEEPTLKTLNRIALRVKILEETAEAKEEQINILDNRMAARTQKLRELNAKVAVAQASLLEIKTSAAELTASTNRKISILKKECRDIEENKKVVQSELMERKHYRNEQEKLISEALEEGNLKLKSVGFEIDDLEEKKALLNRALYDLNQEKSQLIDDIARTHDGLIALGKEYVQELEKHQTKIKNWEEKSIAAEQHYIRIVDETDQKLKTLDIKERSLLAHEAATRREQAELQIALRRQQSAKHFYDT